MNVHRWIDNLSHTSAHSAARRINRHPQALFAMFALIAMFASPVSAQKQKPQDFRPPQPVVPSDWARIRIGLSKAKPMPLPKNGLNSADVTPSGNRIHFDAKTLRTYELAPVETPADASTRTHVEGGGKGVLPQILSGTPAKAIKSNATEGTGTAQGAPRIQDITPTQPTAITLPYSFPFDTQFKLLLRFNDGSNDYYYFCSASSTDSFHLLSAGHCLYNHDIRDDGSNIAGFAAETWAWAAHTDVVDPVDYDNWPDFPWGVAKMTDAETYTAWVNNSDLNHDFSFITLDRRIGDHVSWMGREWGYNRSSLNFDGYPAEVPYFLNDQPFQYKGFDSGNVSGYTDNRINMDAYVYGGHSGGGVWYYDGTNRYIEGVNSTSDRAGHATATRFTSADETTLENFQSASSAPVDRPQVIEYAFDNNSKGLIDTSVSIGSAFGLQLNAFNAGFADAGDVQADIFLTEYENNVTGGTYIGTVDLGDIGAYTYTIQTPEVTVPVTVPPGYWYVGYNLRSANPTYGTDRTDVIITKQTLQTYCTADGYESDNTAATASTITSGGVQGHSICAQGDVDWVKFTLGASSAITLQTYGGTTGGDTTLTLYDGNLNQIDFDDDNGTNYYSTINRVCSSNPLPAGTYYAAVQSYRNRTIIPDYNLNLSATPCFAASLSGLSLVPNVVNGGQSSTGTVTLNGPAQFGGITVNLHSDNAAIHVPATVFVAAGSSTATFAVTTSTVSSTVNGHVTASYNGVSKTAAINVHSTAAALSAVSVLPTAVYAGQSASGTVTLSAVAPAGGIIVTLSADNAAVHLPASVTVAAGATTAPFTVTTTVVAANVNAHITGAYNGVSKTAAFNVKVSPAALTALSLSPNVVTAGQASTGTVTLSAAAPAGGAPVALSSDNAATHVPASVTVAAGATTATFTVTTGAVTATANTHVTASYLGVSKKAAFNIHPATTALTALSVVPNVINAGQTTTGNVSISVAAPAGGFTINLSSDNAAARVPAFVTVPAGATLGHFTITTTAVTTTASTHITASALGVNKTAALNVHPSTTALSALSLSPNVVNGGANSTGTVTLTVAAPTGGVPVTLSADNAAVHVPASVLVPAGATTATFTITTSTVTATVNAHVSASLLGVTKTAAFNLHTP